MPKPDGGMRICGYYKVMINPVLEIDQFPVPTPEDLFAMLAGGQTFTELTVHKVNRHTSRSYLMPRAEGMLQLVHIRSCTNTIGCLLEWPQPLLLSNN